VAARRRVKQQRVGLAHPWLTPAYGDVLENTMRLTKPGQADFVNPDSLHTCSQCQHWLKEPRSADKGRCGLYQRRMSGHRGAVLKGTQQACRQWMTNLGDGRRSSPELTFPAIPSGAASRSTR
jgi:hypothetical protein